MSPLGVIRERVYVFRYRSETLVKALGIGNRAQHVVLQLAV